MKLASSLIQHLLGWFFEFTAALVDELLLLGLFLGQGGRRTALSSVRCCHCSSVGCLSVGLLEIILRLCLFHCWVALIHSGAALTICNLVTRLDHWCLSAWNPLVLLWFVFLIARWFLPNYVEHRVLKCFFIFTESVLFPGVVECLRVITMSLHARFK